jgi:hypothetical protein
LAHAPQQLAESGIAGQIRAQDERRNQQPDQVMIWCAATKRANLPERPLVRYNGRVKS